MTAVIFDIGGVLVHDIWEPLCFGPGGFADTYNLPRKQFYDFATSLNVEYARSTPEMVGTWQQAEYTCWSRVIEEFSAYFPDSIIPEDLIQMVDDFIHPLNQEKMIAIFDGLNARGVPIAICSDMSPFHYARLNEQLHLEKYFKPENIIVSCNIGCLKMDGFRMFEAVTGALHMDPKQCMFFDDREVNIKMATAFGIEGVLVPPCAPATATTIEGALVGKGLIS